LAAHSFEVRFDRHEPACTPRLSGAVEAGKLTLMSTVASGAPTMKMTSKTSMTSMNGSDVDLMQDIEIAA
jgi:hypothetical protein